MKRVSIVGNAGSGKSRLAQRLAVALDVPHVGLDAIHHLPNWEPIDPGEFLATVSTIAATDAWVIDGNYRTVVVDGPVRASRNAKLLYGGVIWAEGMFGPWA